MILEQKKHEERLYWQVEERFRAAEQAALICNGWRLLDLFPGAQVVECEGTPAVCVMPECRGTSVVVMTRPSLRRTGPA